MSSMTQMSGSYSIKKDDFIAVEGENAVSLNLLIQGKLDVYISSIKKGLPKTWEDLRHKSYRLFDIEQNIFIGVNDLLRNGKNSLTVATAADCNLYAYLAENGAGTMNFIHNQRDYGAYVINSFCTLINNSVQTLQKVNSYYSSLKNIHQNLCIYYLAIAEAYGISAITDKIAETGNPGLALSKELNIQVPVYFNKQYVETVDNEPLGLFDEGSDIQRKVDYYIHMLNIPADIRKAFFGADRYVASTQINEASGCFDQIVLKLRQSINRLEDIIDLLYSDSNESLYKTFIKAANELKEKSLDCIPALNAASYILDKLKEVASYIDVEYKHNIGIDFKYFEHEHINAISALETKFAINSMSSISLTTNGGQSLPEELIDSAVKILEYAELSEEKSTCFMMNLTAFRNLKDKLSTEDVAKEIRSTVTELYFEIYPAIFKKSYHLKDNSRLIRMFLTYGYMDERLLEHEQVMAIYKLAGMDHTSGMSNFYYIQDWFAKIYTLEKEPSINHFGHDYSDTFRELKKRGQLTDKDKAAYDQDLEGRLSFENNNMFRLNHKLCQGQIAQYFPILHKDMAPYNPIRSHVTPALIQEKVNRILETDFSVFHREVHYRDSAKCIEKEIVMMQVIPDFILVPVYGSRAMMWQEIAGRVRSNPGRIILPVFTDENLDEMLLKLIGNFRWELCRTMMGTAWNDVTQSSLSSEYADYIQFYRKNRDLSEEAKEKVKTLTTKYHNKLRDMFTSDYEIWINNESKGNPRLNKVARGILFKHCPFSKGIREQLEKQPIYTDYISVSKFQRAKQAKELENHYKHYIKLNGTLDPTLQKNLEFFRDL